MSFRDLPSLNALRAFESAARLGSMSRAAAELFVTHGAVSRQIRTLEQTLGAALFERAGRGVALTEAGMRLRDGCALAFAQLRSSWLDARQAGSSALVLGCAGSVLARFVIPRIERLTRDLPQLALRMVMQDDPFASGASAADLTLALATPPWPATFAVHELAAERIGPVLSPRHPDAARLAALDAAALWHEPLLETASRPQAWAHWARATGLTDDAPSTRQRLPHLYFLLEAAAAGLGVAIAPESLVRDDLANQRLIAPWGFRPSGGRWILATRRRGDARVDALAAWLRDELSLD